MPLTDKLLLRKRASIESVADQRFHQYYRWANRLLSSTQEAASAHYSERLVAAGRLTIIHVILLFPL